jgi:hypothetical protein
VHNLFIELASLLSENAGDRIEFFLARIASVTSVVNVGVELSHW